MIENVIIANLIKSKQFARKVIPFLQTDYLQEIENKYVFNIIKNYVIKYSALPTQSNLMIELDSYPEKMNENLYTSIKDKINKLNEIDKEERVEWLFDKTEEYCKERALHNAIFQSIEIIEKNGNTQELPALVQEALRVEFRTNVGYELLNDRDINNRWEAYNRVVRKIPLGIYDLDDCLGGGLELKSLNLTLGQTNSGKTSAFCAFASNMVTNGEDVLYITLEMAEEKILQRIEANRLNIDINDIPLMGEKKYKQSINKLKDKVKGRMVVKEFPTASINSNHIKNLLTELEIKKQFKPTVVIVDYINLLNSSRVKDGNSYTIVKSIAEELRGIAVEFELCMITGTQITRSGFNASDVNLEDTSECLDPNTKVISKENGVVSIDQLKIGELILGNERVAKVKNIFEKKIKRTYRIKTKSGLEIICSEDHKFPTLNGLINIKSGLKIGDKLKKL